MLSISMVKMFIPEIKEYIKEGNKIVFDKDENGNNIIDIERYYDAKRKCPYYTVQLNMQDRCGRDSFFINAKIYFYTRKRDYKLTVSDEVLETVLEYEIEHEANVKSVYEVIQTIDSKKCLVEREVQKSQISERAKSAYIAERIVEEERNEDGAVIERLMMPGEVLVPYATLVGSEKWTRYQNNPIYVKNLRYIRIDKPKAKKPQNGEMI